MDFQVRGRHPQPPKVVCKVRAQSECIHVAHAFFFCTFGTDLHAQSVLINEISAAELSWKFIKGALLVGTRRSVNGSLSSPSSLLLPK